MSEKRQPQQKRSLEKKARILEHGFRLFCEKGYYKTTTIDIAKAAGISTGALYSYYSDKRDIFIESFEDYMDSHFTPLYEALGRQTGALDIDAFIQLMVSFFTGMYSQAEGAMIQLAYVMTDDEVICQHFCHYEAICMNKIYSFLVDHGLPASHLMEKIFVAYTLIDSLGEIIAYPSYENIDTGVLEKMIRKIAAETILPAAE